MVSNSRGQKRPLISKNQINIFGFIFWIVLVAQFFIFLPAFASSIYGGAGPDIGLAYPGATGLANSDVRITVAKILRIAMSLLGTIFVVIVIWGGYEWMTAGGNDQQIGTAKKRIYAGVIGLALILSSYAIASFVVSSLATASVPSSW